MDLDIECLQKMVEQYYHVVEKRADIALQYKYSSLKSKKKFISLRSHTIKDHSLLMSKSMSNISFELGIVAGKKVGNAVKRNYAKRLIRNAVREIIRNKSSPHAIILLIAKKQILSCKFSNLTDIISEIYDRVCTEYGIYKS